MKILTNKKYEQLNKKYNQLKSRLESLERRNRFLTNGYRAMSICLEFEKAIIGIMKQCNLKEIELPDDYIFTKDILEVTENKLNNSSIIKIKEMEE